MRLFQNTFFPDFQSMQSLMYSSLRIFRRMLQLWLFESDLKVVQGDCGPWGVAPINHSNNTY